MPHPIYRVFISSTFRDLAPERTAVAEAIVSLNDAAARVGIALVPIDLRRGASPEPPLGICLKEAKASDIVITIVGQLYGSETDSGISFTEAEFDAAADASIKRFAYFKNAAGIVLPEHIETDSAKRQKLCSFREKIDLQLKRETFLTADELRGDVIRDLLSWLLDRPEVISSMARMAPATVFPGSRAYFDFVSAGNLEAAAELALSRTFTQDMTRHGLRRIHQAILGDLLNLGKPVGARVGLSRPTRARVLLRFIEGSLGTLRGAIALREAQAMVDELAQPHFTYEVLAAELKTLIGAERYDLGRKCIKRMLRAAKKTRDNHVIAQCYGTMGSYYAAQGDHRGALKFHWEEINTLCKMKEMCPFCLSNAFRNAGNEHMAIGECVLANDRFGKALVVARSIPNRVREIQALHMLTRHWAFHGAVRPAVAGYVLLARLAAEHDPTIEDASLGLLLGEMEVEHGHDKIASILRDVEKQAEQVVDEALAPYELRKFVEDLGLKPNTEGDHW